MIRARYAALFLVCSFAFSASAQRADSATAIFVKTVPLHHLSSAAAVKLLMPYVRAPIGGVFEAPGGVSAVTIRETQPIYNEMSSFSPKAAPRLSVTRASAK